MDFDFSDEQQEFRDTLRRFFEEQAPSAEVRRAIESKRGYDEKLWKQMSEELGLPGVHLPESCGGQGFGFLELGIVVEEMGRVLLPGPYLASALASLAIRGLASDAHPLLGRLASGEERAALAVVESRSDWSSAGIATLAAPAAPDGLRLRGTKSFVPDGQAAEFFVVVARLPDTRGDEGITLAVVRADAPGVRVEPVEAMDPLRRQVRLVLDDAPAEPLGEPGAGAPALRRALAHACILHAAEMVGATERCLEMAVDYAKERVQFGRAVGTFQALKHEAAECLLELELARSTAYWALWVADEDGDELFEAAHLAKSLAGDALRKASEANIQIHGGVGFTWEYDPHLYYKRWHSSDVLYGDAGTHRAALGRELGL
ncbi:MAG: acyl-CoA dehydrogenase family protein [Myxococcota bacterium]|nr:acyl-CoA dehydrogenase family protein [Myxococcota bacterium]